MPKEYGWEFKCLDCGGKGYEETLSCGCTGYGMRRSCRHCKGKGIVSVYKHTIQANEQKKMFEELYK